MLMFGSYIVCGCLWYLSVFCAHFGPDNYPCSTPMTEPVHAGPKDRPTMPYSTPPGQEDLEYVSDELPDPKSLCIFWIRKMGEINLEIF